MPAKEAARVRVQVYLTDPKIIAALNREAKVSKLSLSQAAGRAIGRGLKRSPPADVDDRLLNLERRLGDHVRATSRDLQFVQELQVEGLREFFLAVPEDPVARDGRLGLAAANRIERLLDRVASAIVRGSARKAPPSNLEAELADSPARLQAAE